MEDPNWFFSTLAQSAAAIVGLIGAFLVSRIVDELRRVEEKKREILGEISKLETGNAYNNLASLIKNYQEIYHEIHTGKKPIIAPGWGITIDRKNMNKLAISRLLSNGIGLFREKMIFIGEIILDSKLALEKPIIFYNSINRHIIQWEFDPPYDVVIDQTFKNQFTEVIKLERDIIKIKNDYENFRNSFGMPSYLWVGLILLGIIAFSFVFLPLKYLWAGENTQLKDQFLLWFGFAITALLTFFSYQIIKIKGSVEF